MGKIYVGQSALNIKVTTGIDLTNATSYLIKYRKPDNTEHFWTPTIFDSPTKGILEYDVQDNTEIDQRGEWTIWSYVTFSDGRTAMGTPSCFTVYLEGTC